VAEEAGKLQLRNPAGAEFRRNGVPDGVGGDVPAEVRGVAHRLESPRDLPHRLAAVGDQWLGGSRFDPRP
jgi:hypothetical protein